MRFIDYERPETNWSIWNGHWRDGCVCLSAFRPEFGPINGHYDFLAVQEKPFSSTTTTTHTQTHERAQNGRKKERNSNALKYGIYGKQSTVLSLLD